MRYFIIVIMISFTAVCMGQSRVASSSVMTNDQWDFIGANRMLMWVGNNGGLSFNPTTGGPGLEWPRGSGRYLAFMQGLVWGGLVQGEVRIGGSTYRHGWQAGVILADGTADDASLPEHRIYRAHRFDAAWWNTQSEGSRAQLLQDLREWPVQYGAQWVDANTNGVYDPDTAVWVRGGVTDAPLMRGDEMLWFACNDLDARRTFDLYGSTPTGIEMHTLVRASAGHPLLDNVVFREHTLINKGISDVTEMSLAMWEDADLGEGFDDFCGVDTALGLAYSYNGLRKDNIYGVPPASGTLWLQTPVVRRPGAIAHFGDGMRRDFENLPLSTFMFYIGGSSIYREANIGVPSGANMMMNNLMGRSATGMEFVDPLTAQPTSLLLTGDPVTGSGWVDGIVSSPGDRRFLSGSGRFTLAMGDTQKVLTATIAVDGGNQLLSVRALRNAARQLHDIYHNLPFGTDAPVLSSRLTYGATPGYYELRVAGGPFPVGTTAVAAVLRSADGSEIQRGMMFDDGQHDDGNADDGVFGAILPGSGKSTGADLFVVTTDAGGEKEWFVESELALPGPAHALITDIALDSPKSDGKAQPGEYVRLRLRIENGTTEEMGPWHLFFRDEPSLHIDRAVQRYPGTIAAGGQLEPVYDPGVQGSYIGIDLPADLTPGTYVIPVTLISAQHCLWNQDLLLSIDSLPAASPHGLLAHVQGRATGSLGYTITRPEILTDHDYRVSIEGEDFDAKTMHVEDVTLGTTLYRGIPVPDRYEPFSPEIDGWQINIGTAFDQLVYNTQGERLEAFTPDATGVFAAPERSWFTLNLPEYLAADRSIFPSILSQYDLQPVRLVFDRGKGQKAAAYLRGTNPNYGYQGYFDIPVRAFDISDSANPRQLMLGFVEQINRPGHDSTYMPTTEQIDREILIVFADDYADTPDVKFLDPLSSMTPRLDVLYSVWALRDTTAPMFADGDAYTITPRIPVSNRDVYILAKPRLLDVRSEQTSPTALTLHAVYPNPVRGGSGSSSATIRFDTPLDGHARVTVHDILGRCVATLVDQELPVGTHSVRLESAALRGGTYIVVLDAQGRRAARTVTVLR
ncbi:MAG: T9SS type A sorting domain-containing protein [Bacteroidetes bacterium]|nr:T9SS type A sorting domain-containing protein [Bacteroidota bacterium]